MQQAGTVTLLGRANTQLRPQNRQAAYQLRISNTGAWSIAKHTTGNATTNSLPAPGRRWPQQLAHHQARLRRHPDHRLRRRRHARHRHRRSFGSGQAGLGVVGYQTDQFDNLTVTANGGGNGNVGGVLRGQESGRCVDVPGATQSNSTVVTLWDCNGGSNQSWTATPGKQLQVYGTKCLDVSAGGTSDGTAVIIYDCTGGTNQQWTVNSDGTVVGAGSGKCLDATGHGTANGTLLEIWTCNGGANQKWSRS